MTASDRPRVLVYGGRDYQDAQKVHEALGKLNKRLGDFLLIQGGATGADRLARDFGILYGFPTVTMHAAWDFYRKAAGLIRNKWMADYLEPTYAVQFPGGTGTANMRGICDRMGIPVWEPEEQAEPV